MIELVFVACLAAAPQECSERALLFTDITPMMCLRHAQPNLARWSNAHPGHDIKSFMCRRVSFVERDT